jgi:hypothetical protein
LEIERASALLKAKSDWRATKNPLTPSISLNTSNQNFEMAILFNVVESSGNEVFEDDNPPTDLRSSVVLYALGAYKPPDPKLLCLG